MKPPKIEWVWLENYKLADLAKDFEIADFERKISHQHVDKILDGILKNEFFDIVIKAFKPTKPGGKRVVFDAQHRIHAFMKARDLHGLKTYTFMLALYPHEQARIIYRRTNIGKKLIAGDHTKAMDDKTLPFFNELRKHLFHYRNDERMSFIDMMYALDYAKGATPQGDMNKIDDILQNITPKDVKNCRIFLEFMTREYPSVRKEPMYMMSTFRNLVRVGVENNYEEHDQYAKLARAIEKNKSIMAHTEIRSKTRALEVYDIIQKEILPKL